MRRSRGVSIFTAVLLLFLTDICGATGQWMDGGSSEPIDEWMPAENEVDQQGDFHDAAIFSEEIEDYSLLFIPGIALKPRKNNVGWGVATGVTGCIYASDGDEKTLFNAPVYLPQGATVKFMRMFYDDTSEIENGTSWFTIYERWGKIHAEYSATYDDSGGVGYATTPEFNHTVDYNHFTYVVNWRPNALGSDIKVCGFRIYYIEPTLKAKKIEIGP